METIILPQEKRIVKGLGQASFEEFEGHVRELGLLDDIEIIDLWRKMPMVVEQMD